MGMMGFTNAGTASGPTSDYAGTDVSAATAGGTSSASLTFNPNGTITTTTSVLDASSLQPTAWYTPTTTSIGNSYWVRGTTQSGVSTGTMGTWLALTSARTWSLSVGSGGASTSVVLFEISSSATGTPVVASGNIIIDVNGAA
jgi:hypothetical protein